MRHKGPWWLSTFYSLCIQSFVRKALLHLAPGGLSLEPRKSFLKTPLRLFIASSGGYDPLSHTPPSSKSSIPRDDDYIQARQAVGRDDWHSQDIDSSAAYLERIFDDKGCPGTIDSGAQHHSPHSQQLPEPSRENDPLPEDGQPYSPSRAFSRLHRAAKEKLELQLHGLFNKLGDAMLRDQDLKDTKSEILYTCQHLSTVGDNEIIRLLRRLRTSKRWLEMSQQEAAALRLENSNLRRELPT
ncbi:uncharacterized protein BP5553_05870 [Venustampulla echinocandica]|uniref:Uncharacterized protein n=1 Tax=Venustampulla echinocandica TaxID=2656787 RepID=A0A370TLX2_9HELO|nr:uncharacterized protein BP5553_05870 [Venustampulla echinocandica]RDL36518.1 hypothetical protein BP5553_05870 [Venustampulla echinocandica]